MKKTAKKRQTPKSRTAAVKASAKRIVKKVAAKVGLSSPSVKKKVVAKLKRVGKAMARAAVDELLPPSQGSAPAKAPTRAKAAPAATRSKPR